MHNSETEEGSEEEEDEEEEDICEEEEEEEEEESEEEDVNGGGGGGGSDRVDLGVQTSLLDSPSPTVSSPSSHTQVSNKNIPKSRFLTCCIFRGSGGKATEILPQVVALHIHRHPPTPCPRIFDIE